MTYGLVFYCRTVSNYQLQPNPISQVKCKQNFFYICTSYQKFLTINQTFTIVYHVSVYKMSQFGKWCTKFFLVTFHGFLDARERFQLGTYFVLTP